MRLWPSRTPKTDDAVTADGVNPLIAEHLEGINGTLNEGQIPKDAIVVAKMKEFALNRFFSTPLVIQGVESLPEDLVDGWNLVDGMTLAVTARDGMLSGAFSGNIRKYGVGVGTTTDPNWNPWRVAIFMDGAIIADSDDINEEQPGVMLPFAVPIGAGDYTLEVKVRGLMLSQTIDSPSAGVGNGEIFRYGDCVLWARNQYG